MYTFVLDDFQSLNMKKNTFFQFRTVHKTSSYNLFAFEATLKEEFFYMKKMKKIQILLLSLFQSIGYFILSCDVALLDLCV